MRAMGGTTCRPTLLRIWFVAVVVLMGSPFGLPAAGAQGGAVDAKPRSPIPLTRSVSGSRQFHVYGDDRGARQGVASDVEGVKERFLRSLRLRDRWVVPIVVVLREGREPRTDLTLFQTEQGLKIEINRFSPGAKHPLPPEDVLRALLLELAYRGETQVEAGTEIGLPPAWLVEGVMGLMQADDGEMDASIYAALVKSGSVPDLERFLRENPLSMDGTSRQLHRVYSVALVRMLADESDGIPSLISLIQMLPDVKILLPDFLFLTYPTLVGGEELITKKWALAMARLSTFERLDYWPVPESWRRISNALRYSVPTPEEDTTVTLDLLNVTELPQLLARKDRRAVFQQFSSQLESISPRVHPVLMPAATRFLATLESLAKGRAKGSPEELQTLSDFCSGEAARAEDIADHLNWVEATQVGTVSGVFEGYLRSADKPQPRPRRADPLSKYLDLIEIEFE